MMMETPARSGLSGIAALDSSDLEIPSEIGLSNLYESEPEFTDEDAKATILRFLKRYRTILAPIPITPQKTMRWGPQMLRPMLLRR